MSERPNPLTHSPGLALLAALLVVLPASLRLVGLEAFPGVLADEGLWTNGAKNQLLFGDWFMDGRTHALLSPVFHGLSWLSFWGLGASIENARLVSALAGTLSVPLLFYLVRRTTGRRDLALTTAVLFGTSAAGVFAARTALIESTQLFFLLLAACCVARQSAVSALAGGLALGLALLSKLNAGVVGAILVLLLLPSGSLRAGLRDPERWGWALLFAVTAAVVAGAGYGGLYLAEPERFVAAFRFELDGVVFEGLSEPLLQVGRLAIDPVLASRSVIALVRDAPFQLVLCLLGAGIGLTTRPRPPLAFWAWLLGGTGFVLIQMYQPLRYFQLMAPMYAFFAALAIHGLVGAGRRPGAMYAPAQAAALAAYLAFNLGYLGMNAVANRDTRLAQVVEWVETHTDPARDPIVAAGYFCTDLPNRAYAYYHLGEDIAQLEANLRRYEIAYVIYDANEWPAPLGEALSQRFERVHAWPFGAVYRVDRALP